MTISAKARYRCRAAAHRAESLDHLAAAERLEAESEEKAAAAERGRYFTMPAMAALQYKIKSGNGGLPERGQR